MNGFSSTGNWTICPLAFEAPVYLHPTNDWKAPTRLSEMRLSFPPHRFSSGCDGCRERDEPWEQALLDWREESYSQTDLLVSEPPQSHFAVCLQRCLSCSFLLIVLCSDSLFLLTFILFGVSFVFSFPNQTLFSCPVRCPTMTSSSLFSWKRA